MATFMFAFLSDASRCCRTVMEVAGWKWNSYLTYIATRAPCIFSKRIKQPANEEWEKEKKWIQFWLQSDIFICSKRKKCNEINESKMRLKCSSELLIDYFLIKNSNISIITRIFPWKMWSSSSSFSHIYTKHNRINRKTCKHFFSSLVSNPHMGTARFNNEHRPILASHEYRIIITRSSKHRFFNCLFLIQSFVANPNENEYVCVCLSSTECVSLSIYQMPFFFARIQYIV